MRLAINGFGRIGRTILRQLLTSPAHADIAIARINDIAPVETLAYLFKYDSVYGPYPGHVDFDAGHLIVDDHRIPVTDTPDVAALQLDHIDLLMECTGKLATRAQAKAGLHSGAAQMLISGPCDGADMTCVLDANEGEMADHRIISNASCTTNAMAPLLKALHATCGISRGHMTTVHVYTGSQPMVDAPRGATLARSRAGAVSMVPTTTSATRLIDGVLPQIAGRVTGAAVRVPAISVSAIDLVVTLKRPPANMTDSLRQIAEASPVIAAIKDACVSTDLRGRPESLIIALPETVVSGPQVRILGWYDNEWGFSARMIDLARLMVARDL
ncbi:MAG: glyceraldehyde 3-phosphate dehydrogenase NAD-binding domain-containing protein [Paracoccaceae bacterium]|nr:glyceraldehyde 3-phosphate dehydrogenase NAD-binding domain-containing protein [Paracoccaceae bacterium]